MKAFFTTILALTFVCSSFALLEGYTPITDQNEIAKRTDVLSTGLKTALLLARNDPTVTNISPGYFTMEVLREFGAAKDTEGTFYEIICDVAPIDDRENIAATIDMVVYQADADDSFVFMSYRVDAPWGNSRR